MDSLEESLTDNDEVEEVLRRTGGTTGATNRPLNSALQTSSDRDDPQVNELSLEEGEGEKSKLECSGNNSDHPRCGPHHFENETKAAKK